MQGDMTLHLRRSGGATEQLEAVQVVNRKRMSISGTSD
jgi:hypothetical protein